MEAATIASIESVYRSRGADFFRLALARTSDPDLARDAVQKGFARALRARAGFRGAGSLEAWVGRCVLNAAHDARRDVAELELIDPDGTDPFLRFYLDFDYAAIAETLEIEIGTVSATLHAARTNLAHALEEATR